MPVVKDAVEIGGKLLCQQPEYDRIINADVMLQNGDSLKNERVLQRSIGSDGQISGKYNNNPSLNSIVYDVEFPNRIVKEYSAKIISENMLTQVD